MSNSPSICWKCKHRETCKMFNKNSKAEVTKCGRFLMKDEYKEMMQILYEELNKSESEKV